MTTWCYWSGPRSPAIELCLESLARHNPDLEVVDDDYMQQHAPQMVELVSGRSPQVRADLYRLWLLAEHGGQWVDADCVALRRLDMAEQLSEQVDLVCFSNGNSGHVSNAIMAAKPHSALAREALRRAIEVAKAHRSDQQIQYGATGQGVLGPLAIAVGKRLKVCQRFRWAPVRFTEVGAFARLRPDGRHATHPAWRANARTYHFTGKGLLAFGRMTREQILASDCFGSFLLRRSLGRVRPLRAREILHRVPAGQRVVGAEVGVHRAQNAEVLLQQRPQLELHLIDMWSTNEQYRRSGDALSKRSLAARQSDYQLAKHAVAFAVDRVMFHRGQSTAEAGEHLDGSLDFVFIDADHSYDGCRADIDAWLPKVKRGGWIGGHDYGHKLERKGLWGVKRAVDEAAEEHGLIVETGQDLTWFCRC